MYLVRSAIHTHEQPAHRPAKKRIRTGEDVEKWQRCESYQNIVAFFTRLGESVKGITNTQGRAISTGSPALKELVARLDQVKTWVAEIPLGNMQSQRYGNKAFRQLHEQIVSQSEADMKKVIAAGGGDEGLAEELAVYWNDSFGNETRIDYGTGHELNFGVLLFCLDKIGCVGKEEGDQVAMVTTVFVKYLEIMRLLQSHYSMEPAGSKGVWGLDDYHHLNFYWGASQLIDSRGTPPSQVQELCHEHAADYLYMDGVAWILRNKSGNFNENSPTLASLVSLQWPKITGGMMKMYKGEVLGQWPVVQHLCFGTVLPYNV